MRGLFVTGTDTGIGKTLVSAWLVRGWRADYWKPVQTGAAEDSDSDAVRQLARAEPERIHPPAHVYQEPLSPHEAARREGARIDLADFRSPATPRPLVVEGAGGVLVPLNERDLMADLIALLGMPALVVARSTLGTINHTLLTLEALRRRRIPVAGVVMSGPPVAHNREAIEHYGRVPVLAEIPPLAAVTPEELEALPPPPPLETLSPQHEEDRDGR